LQGAGLAQDFTQASANTRPGYAALAMQAHGNRSLPLLTTRTEAAGGQPVRIEIRRLSRRQCAPRFVHFYNTRDVLPRCAVGDPGEKVSCWPAPETPWNINAHCCNLGLSDADEDDIVAFLRTLSDGYPNGTP
jgi:hypothetical protein